MVALKKYSRTGMENKFLISASAMSVRNMKNFKNLLLAVLVLLTTTSSNAEEAKGVIGRMYEDGLPVIYKFVNEMPSKSIREQLTWLTVISWKYDGVSNNGMPKKEENQRMIKLEDTIEDYIENDKILRHVYSRTGNNLKELVYYIHDRDQFQKLFNKALKKHPRYPIEITFYKDNKWEDFQRLLNSFNKKG